MAPLIGSEENRGGGAQHQMQNAEVSSSSLDQENTAAVVR